MRFAESKTFAILAGLALLLALGAREAFAHKVNVFATAEGRTISGSVYFSSNAKARDVKVGVYGPGKKKLGETRTDEKGQFTFVAQFQCAHTFIAVTSDGHQGEYTLAADELPRELPTFPAGQGGESAPQPETAAETATPAASDPSAIEEAVEKAVSRQIAPLRKDIKAYEEKVGLHDILGGIGYILGIAGIVFYFRGAARKPPKSGPEARP